MWPLASVREILRRCGADSPPFPRTRNTIGVMALGQLARRYRQLGGSKGVKPPPRISAVMLTTTKASASMSRTIALR